MTDFELDISKGHNLPKPISNSRCVIVKLEKNQKLKYE